MRIFQTFSILLIADTLWFASSAFTNETNMTYDLLATPGRDVVLFGEPFVLRVIWTNRSDQTVKVPTEMQPGVLAEYETSQDGVSFRRLHPGFYRDPVGHIASITGHGVWVHNEVLICDWRESVPLLRPGTNYIKVSYFGKIVSPVVKAIVQMPTDAEDAKSAQVMTMPKVMKAILLHNVSETQAELNSVVQLDSSLSPYAAYFLAAYYGGSATLEEKALMLDIADIEGFPLRTEVIQQKAILARQTIQAQVRLKPEALAVSPGILTAFVRLPEGYPVSGITSATCDGAPSERMMPNEDGTEMIMKFRRQNIEAALAQIGESLDTNFVVRGTWQGAAGNRLFLGVDSIAKIVGAREK